MIQWILAAVGDQPDVAKWFTQAVRELGSLQDALTSV